MTQEFGQLKPEQNEELKIAERFVDVALIPFLRRCRAFQMPVPGDVAALIWGFTSVQETHLSSELVAHVLRERISEAEQSTDHFLSTSVMNLMQNLLLTNAAFDEVGPFIPKMKEDRDNLRG